MCIAGLRIGEHRPAFALFDDPAILQHDGAKPVPPKTRILVAQSEHIAADKSQKARPKILFRVHV